jgi:hypothetical protein
MNSRLAPEYQLILPPADQFPPNGVLAKLHTIDAAQYSIIPAELLRAFHR